MAPRLPVNLDWHPTTYRLRFQLGDRALFVKNIRLNAAQFSLIDLLQNEECHTPPLWMLPHDLAGCLIRSAPDTDSDAPLTRIDGYLRYVIARFPRHYINLAGSFDTYVQSHFSAKTRSTLQRKVRRLAEHAGGNIEWKAYRTVAELAVFHPLALSVSEQTYQQQLFDSGLPQRSEFLEEMRRLAQADAVRGYLLFVRDAPVAYMYLPAMDGILGYAYLGFVPTFREWSVGTILHWFALKDLFTEARFKFLDLTEGDGEHKRLFATGSIPCQSILFLRDSFGSRAVLRAHLLIDRFSQSGGKFLDRLRLKSRVRRVSRYGLRGLWVKNS